MPEQDQLSLENEKASQYGWALGFLKAYPELYAVFKKAIDPETGGWTGPRFVAAIRNTKWYRTYSEHSRQIQVLKKTDPAEYTRRLRATFAQVQDSYLEKYGQAGNPAVLRQITNQAFSFGLTEAEINNVIGRSANINALMKKGLGGTLGEAEQAIRKSMEDYGVDLSDSWMAGQLQGVANGTRDAGATMDYIRNVAKNKYRGFAQQIDQGITIREIAEPYKQLMAKTLELSDSQISVSNKHIQRALLAYDKKSNQPAPKPLWQFEQDLKDDPRWDKTNNAQAQMMEVGRKVLSDWGIVGSNG